MPHRRLTMVTTTVLASALALSACGSKEAAKPTGPLKDVTVDGGNATTAPTVTVKPKPLSVTETTTRTVKEGKGPAVTGKEIVSLRYELINATTGAKLEDNYGKPNLGLNLGEAGLLPGLAKGLKGAKTGSQMLVAMPPKDAFGDQGNTQAKVGAKDTVLFLFDVLGTTTPLAEATGTAVAPKAGLPSVKWAKDKPATFTMPTTAPPKNLVIQPLIEGKGAVVKDGQTARVTYTGALYRGGKVFDSSANSPKKYFEFPVGQSQVIKGWDKGVTGQKVGSRILLVVPPAEGYGTKGSPQAGIKGTDTLVFVVDILAAY